MGITFNKLFETITENELKEKLQLSTEVLEKLKNNKGVSTEIIDLICGLLKCQPGDIMKYIPEDEYNL